MWIERTSNGRRPSVAARVWGGAAAAAVRIRDRVASSRVAPTSTRSPARMGALDAFAYVIRPASVIRLTGVGAHWHHILVDSPMYTGRRLCIMRHTQGVAGATGEFHGTASHRIGRPTRAGSQWRDRPRRGGDVRMDRRFMPRLAVAVSTAAVVLSLSASAVFAGEITGNGTRVPPEGEPRPAKSLCAYSGQNDEYP